jgi:hypothetical protein
MVGFFCNSYILLIIEFDGAKVERASWLTKRLVQVTRVRNFCSRFSEYENKNWRKARMTIFYS